MPKAEFIPIPPKYCITRMMLEDPKTKKLHKINGNYKLILIAFFHYYNPFFDSRLGHINYNDISDFTGFPVSSIKKMMPILHHNFPELFRKSEHRGFQRGYDYYFDYKFNFSVKGKVSNKPVSDEENQTVYYKKLGDVDAGKWGLFKKIPLDTENKRIRIFEQFKNCEYSYWDRNVRWALDTLNRKPEWHGKIPVKWIWRCLELDFGLNKLSPSSRKAAVNHSPVMEVIKEHGIDIDNVFKRIAK